MTSRRPNHAIIAHAFGAIRFQVVLQILMLLVVRRLQCVQRGAQSPCNLWVWR